MICLTCNKIIIIVFTVNDIKIQVQSVVEVTKDICQLTSVCYSVTVCYCGLLCNIVEWSGAECYWLCCHSSTDTPATSQLWLLLIYQ